MNYIPNNSKVILLSVSVHVLLYFGDQILD